MTGATTSIGKGSTGSEESELAVALTTEAGGRPTADDT